MHGWPVTQSILSLQRGRDMPLVEADLEEVVPESLVAATTRTIMQISAEANAESSSIAPQIRWLVQEALKGLAAN